MDLMLTVNTYELFSAVSLSMMFGFLGTTLLKMYLSHPLLKAAVNTTLVLLENTEVVWRPVVEFSLVIIKPLSDFALALLKPFGPLALVVLDTTVKALVVFGYFTVLTVKKIVSYTNFTIMMIRESGMSVSSAVTNAAHTIKDVAVSLGTITKAFASLTINIIKATSYIAGSFEHVSDFLYRTVFETKTVSWNDIVDVAMPSVVVFSILGLLAWRFSRLMVTPKANAVEVEETYKPRRSPRLIEQSNRLALSRIDRKRAMLSSDSAFSG